MKGESLNSSFFDKVYERRNTGSIKYDSKLKGINADNLIPMWIADMDFKSPPAVEKALLDITKHGFFGYTDTDSDFDTVLCNWYHRHMKWAIQPEWIIKTPGVMFGISAAIRALTDPSDSILICQPVYYPFEKTILANGRHLVVSELLLIDGQYTFDFEDIEHKIVQNNVKMFLLCSPHNPIGRVWTEYELKKIGDICLRHGVYIVSDEIHCDFIYSGFRHVPIASLSDEISKITITCLAPTKTFNLAGLQAASIIVPNNNLRKKIRETCLSTGYSHLNIMTIAATKAAYQHGDEWLKELLTYLQGNIAVLKDAFPKQCDISLIQPEGTYLMWLDCRKLGLKDEELRTLFLEKAGVWLHSGSTFGIGGSGFMRMNIACPRITLETAVHRIKQALVL